MMFHDPFAFADTNSEEGLLPQGQKKTESADAIDFEKELNPEQYAAVTANHGPALVLAGAGSGKTRTLTYRVAYLLEQGIKPWEILLITFTNKAAKEMLHRVEELTGIPQHHFWGGTFHHIGQKFLRLYGEKVNVSPDFIILDQSDAEALLTDAIRDADSAFFRNKDNPKAKIVAEILSYARNTFKSIKTVLEEKHPYFLHLKSSIESFALAYRDRKRKQNVADYDDLMELWVQVLRDHPEACEAFTSKFRHVLVDEYQDTNSLQAEIVDRMAPHHCIMAVGDDAQCIYTWRGANFQNIINFPERHPGTVIYKIETNYRSSPQILALANEVLRNQPSSEGYSKELKAVLPSRQKPYVVEAMDSRTQAQFIIRRIHGLLGEGRNPKDIAILYRAHYQAMDLQMELSRQQIPYVITSGVRFFDQAHVKDLIAQIRFAWNPQDTIAFLRFACLLPKVGPRTAERLLDLAHKEAQKNKITTIQALSTDVICSKIPADALSDWKELVQGLRQMEEALRPPIEAPSEDSLFQAKTPKTEFIPESPQGIVKIAIEAWYGDFLRTLHTNWTARRDDLESLIPFAQRYPDMTEFLNQLVLLNSETTERSTDDTSDAIRLTTIHQSKGLEYPVVFVIGLAEGYFPIKRAIEDGNVEEERRLFYVAVTRAREELYISYPLLNFQGGPVFSLERSSFLEELPEHTYEMLQLSKRPAR
jgi:DNA helicase-2/ATP-dependent DNA helicase PcrA